MRNLRRGETYTMGASPTEGTVVGDQAQQHNAESRPQDGLVRHRKQPVQAFLPPGMMEIIAPSLKVGAGSGKLITLPSLRRSGRTHNTYSRRRFICWVCNWYSSGEASRSVCLGIKLAMGYSWLFILWLVLFPALHLSCPQADRLKLQSWWCTMHGEAKTGYLLLTK